MRSHAQSRQNHKAMAGVLTCQVQSESLSMGSAVVGPSLTSGHDALYIGGETTIP
jgi:hypothetical protein